MGNASSRKKKQTSGAEHANSPVVEGGKLPATTGGIPSMVHFSSAKDTLESQPASANSPAYACSSVQGKRIGMEDRHIAVRPLYVDRTASANLFGVFDGHGGSTVSSFLSQNMAGAVSWSVQSALTNRTGVEKGLKEAFRQVDAAFLRSTHGNADEGSCAVVVLLQGDKVYCANVGDSRAVLVRKGGSILPLSNDHKPTRPDEKKRIERAGGSVVGGRVMGRLAVSRAFGHKKMKTTGVMSAEAEVISTQLCNTDQFVILACDGLWDVMGAKDAVKVIYSSLKTGADLKGAAKALTEQALKLGSVDNVTAMIVDLAAGPSSAALPKDKRQQASGGIEARAAAKHARSPRSVKSSASSVSVKSSASSHRVEHNDQLERGFFVCSAN